MLTYEPGLTEFVFTHDAGHPQVVLTTMVADLETPVSVFLKLGQNERFSFLLESVEGGATRARYSMIGLRPDIIWRTINGKAEINREALSSADHFFPAERSEAPLESLRSLVAESRIALPAGLAPMAAGIFGYLGYDMVRVMERLPAHNPDALHVPDAILLRPTIVAVFDSVRDTLTFVTPVRPVPGITARQAYEQACKRLEFVVSGLNTPLPHDGGDIPVSPPTPQSNTTHDDYLSMVRRARDYIYAGDIFQVVPSQRFQAPFVLSPFALYRALRRINPSPYLFFLNYGDFALVGSSPEILVRVRGKRITLRPIAGTRPRGETPLQDAMLAKELLDDPKERAEHLMLLDLGRNDVGRVARIGSVQVTEQFVIEYYSHVMHIVSNVEGELAEGEDAVSVLKAAFPAGTLTGAPKVRAMEIIEELEKERRGPYGGCVGYFSAGGDMDTCIVLRTALVKEGMMYVQAGGGVVADSDPEAEYQETINKSRALFRAAEEAVRFASHKNRPKS
jgi:anthranilate synthase component 1